MTNVKIPLPIRVVAYVLCLAPLDAVSSWVIAQYHPSVATIMLLGACLASLHTVAGALSLSHLSIPDADPGTATTLDPTLLDPTLTDPTAEQPAAPAQPAAPTPAAPTAPAAGTQPAAGAPAASV